MHWRYSILNPLGAGGGGSVFLAHDAVGDRTVALKVAGEADGKQLRREFLQTTALRHPLLLEAYDLCHSDAGWTLSLEHFPGTTLQELLLCPPGDPHTAVSVWAELAEALRYLHQHGVMHGDLQPANVLLDGRAVKLIDLGLSRSSAPEPPARFAGVPAYAAPEQLQGGQQPSPAADIYALGLLVWALTGNGVPTVEQRLDPQVRWLAAWNAALPEREQEVLFAMLRYDPWQRLASGRELTVALDEVGITVRRRGITGGFVGRGGPLRSALRLIRDGAARAIRVNGVPGSGRTSFLKRLTVMLQAGGQDCVYLDPRTLRHDLFTKLEIPAATVIITDDAGEATLRLLRQRANPLVYAADDDEKAAAADATIELSPLLVADVGQLVERAFGPIPRHDAGLLAGHLHDTSSGNAGRIAGSIERYLAAGSIVPDIRGWSIRWEQLLASDAATNSDGPVATMAQQWEQARLSGNAGAMIYYGRLLCESGQLAAEDARRYAMRTVCLYHRVGDLTQALHFWAGLEPVLGTTADYYIRLAKISAGAGDREMSERAMARARERVLDKTGQLRLASFGIWSQRGNGAREALAKLRGLLAEAGGVPGAVAFEIYEYLMRLAMELTDWQELLAASEQALRLELSDVAAYDQGMIMGQRGYALWRAGDLEAAEQVLTRGLEVADDGLGDMGLVDILSNLANVMMGRAEWARAGGYLERALQVLPAHQHEEHRAYLLVTMSIVNERTGQYRRARDNNYSAAAIQAALNNRLEQTIYLANAAQMEQVLGNGRQARQLLDRCRQLAADDATGFGSIKVHKELLFINVMQERWAGAWSEFRTYQELVRRHGQHSKWEVLARGTIAAIELGLAGEAASLLAELQGAADNDERREDLELIKGGQQALLLGNAAQGIPRMLAAAEAMRHGRRDLDAALAWSWAGRVAVAREATGSIERVVAGLHAAEGVLRRDGVAGLWRRSCDLIVEASRLQQTAAAGGQALELLDGFYRLATQVGVARDDNAVAEIALRLVVELLQAERGGLFLLGRPNELLLAAQVGLDPLTQQDAREYSREAVLQAAREGTVIVSNDAQLDELFASRVSVQQNAIRSLLCAPVRYREGAIGALYLDSRLKSGIFSPQRREFLSAWCAIVGSVLESNRMMLRLRRENDALRADEPAALREMIGTSPAMQRVLADIRTMAPTEARVLITGESGTGKELAARAIHLLSPRRDRTFLALDCGSLPANLLEAELFGYVRGAFTGAYADKDGLFEAADGGTFFLDEITSASLDVQSKLLRAIESGQIRRVGDTAIRRVDVRLICASNRDMAAEINAGRFKEDLFYRLNVLRLQLPPLRERGDDILILAEHFKHRFQQEQQRTGMRFSERAKAALLNNAWPGNIRELENVIKRAVILTEGKVITEEHIDAGEMPPVTIDIRQEAELVKRKRLADTLRVNDHNITKTAEILGISRRQIHRMISKYSLK